MLHYSIVISSFVLFLFQKFKPYRGNQKNEAKLVRIDPRGLFYYQNTLIDGQAKRVHLHGCELLRHGVQIVGPEEVEGEEGDQGVPKPFNEPKKSLHWR